jgi:16S rRNA (guanine527-N7)-methyltransferase
MSTDNSNPPPTFDSVLRQTCAATGISLSDAQVDLCRAHFDKVIEANTRFNLTRITDPINAAVRHYADSLSLLTWPRTRDSDIRRILDVGTGAGFPAVPLAIVRPDWHLTALDSTGKKVDFVASVAHDLHLANLEARKHRAGQDPHDFPSWDLALFRAVGDLKTCLQTARNLLRPDGFVVCYKSADVPPSEWTAARRLLSPRCYSLDATVPVTLPAPDAPIHRQLLCFRHP